MNKISTTMYITVPFFDLDPMNIVWHGNYVKYLEMVRCDFFKKINYTYDEIYKDGIMYPITKLEMKFVKSAYFGEELKATCTLVETEPALIFKYKIVDAQTKDVLCVAKTMQMGVDAKTKSTVLTLSDKFKRKLEEYEG